jgi:hypothetical protein
MSKVKVTGSNFLLHNILVNTLESTRRTENSVTISLPNFVGEGITITHSLTHNLRGPLLNGESLTVLTFGIFDTTL